MGLRELARKGISLFVEVDEPPRGAAPAAGASPAGPAPAESDAEYVQKLRSKSVGELMKELDGPEPEQIHQAVQAAAPAETVIQGDAVDFSAIYRQAQIPPLQFGAEQMLGMIQSYPTEMALPLKREALDATMKHMGAAMHITKEAIVADATRKITALAAFEEAQKRERDSVTTAAQEKVRELQAQMQAEQQKAAAAEAQFRALVQQCEAEGQRLDQVQEFLTLDSAPAKPAAAP
jgi:hypothetical protein